MFNINYKNTISGIVWLNIVFILMYDVQKK